MPATRNQQLGKQIQTKLQNICGKRIMLQETVGNTVIGQLRKSNPSPPIRCDRKNCKPCLHGLQENKCYTNNIGYRVICNRSPCCDRLKTDNKNLQTEQLRLQLDKLKPGDSKPAIYEGESYRSCYTRGLQHWSNYNTKTGRKRSFMWFHTRDAHNSEVRPDNGAMDYKMVQTGSFQSNLARLVDEGKRQTIMEEYQNKQVIQVLNSKIDFVQPLRTKLTILNKNINYAPGRPDRPTLQQNTHKNRKPLKGKRRLTEQTNNNSFTPTLTSTP